jgi:hypothetical protein
MTENEFLAAGGSAFPTPEYDKGMSLRDYFAAQALTGLLAGDRLNTNGLDAGCISGDFLVRYTDTYTKLAYQLADSMLRVRQPPTAPADAKEVPSGSQ